MSHRDPSENSHMCNTYINDRDGSGGPRKGGGRLNGMQFVGGGIWPVFGCNPRLLLILLGQFILSKTFFFLKINTYIIINDISPYQDDVLGGL